MLLNAKNETITIGDTEMDYISFGQGKEAVTVPKQNEIVQTVIGSLIEMAKAGDYKSLS